jgi:hypothetical protein
MNTTISTTAQQDIVQHALTVYSHLVWPLKLFGGQVTAGELAALIEEAYDGATPRTARILEELRRSPDTLLIFPGPNERVVREARSGHGVE